MVDENVEIHIEAPVEDPSVVNENVEIPFERVAVDDSDEDVFFKLIEPLDIGDENVMDEN